MKIRSAFSQFVKLVLVIVRDAEKDFLDQGEEYTVSNDEGQSMQMERCKAVSSRFINQALVLMNFKVARNYLKYDNYFDLLFGYAFESQAQVQARVFSLDAPADEPQSLGQLAGLDYLCKKQIILKLQDFMLGRRSPLFKTGMNRPDIGGSYTTTDLKPPARIFMKIFTDKKQLERFPMSDQEKTLLL
mmetsp:Transcript_33660/g.51964  ORF Transcript_33660/g.51964 Transcript_33660/m.51964 type:complete len:188 (+) Transcript_33660:7285-7848(+)